MEPLPATAAATRLSPAVRLEAEQRHIEDLDKRIQNLSESVGILERSVDLIRNAAPGDVPNVIHRVRLNHNIPDTCVSSGQITEFLQKALHQTKQEKDFFLKAREDLGATISQVPPELIFDIAVQANQITRAAMARVSHVWYGAAFAADRRESQELLMSQIDRYIAALGQDGYEMPKASRDQMVDALSKIKASIEAVLSSTNKFSSILEKSLAIRDQVVEALAPLGHVNKIDLFQKTLDSLALPPNLAQNALCKYFDLVPFLVQANSKDGESRDIEKSFLCDQLFEQGKIDHALLLAATMEDEDQKAYTLTAMCDQMAGKGDWVQAMLVANKFDSNIRNQAYMLIVMNLVEQEKFNEAKSILSLADESKETIKMGTNLLLEGIKKGKTREVADVMNGLESATGRMSIFIVTGTMLVEENNLDGLVGLLNSISDVVNKMMVTKMLYEKFSAKPQVAKLLLSILMDTYQALSPSTFKK